MSTKEKHKHDEVPRHMGRGKRLTVILCLVILGIRIMNTLGLIEAPWGIREYPDAETQAKIDILKAQAKSEHYRDNPPEYLSVRFAMWPGLPICISVDMNVLKDYNPDDLIAWSELSFNDRRLPSDQVSIMVRNVDTHFGPYITDKLFTPTSRLALELCFKRGLRLEGSNTDLTHLMRISVRDSVDHEILSYEWLMRACSCR